MTHLAGDLAREHARELRAEAARARLAAVARRCHPSALRELIDSLRARLHGRATAAPCGC